MYKINRSPKIRESIQLCNEDGSVKKNIEIVLDINKMSSEFHKNKVYFMEAQRKVQENPNEVTYEELGKTIFALINVVFGEKSDEIMNFFENNWEEMIFQIMPFIIDVIAPKFNEIQKERINEIKKRRK